MKYADVFDSVVSTGTEMSYGELNILASLTGTERSYSKWYDTDMLLAW